MQVLRRNSVARDRSRPLHGLNAQSGTPDLTKHADEMDQIARVTSESHELIEIAVLVYDDIVLQDFAGPLRLV